jgi:ABC-type glycerol-3-phosphate transport system substrate-binding protein
MKVSYRIFFVQLLLSLLILIAVCAPQALAADKPYAGQKVRVLLEDNAWHRNIEKTVGTFTQQTGIEVSLEFLPEVQERDKINLDLTTQAGAYDVFLTDEMYIQKFVKLGELEPLDGYAKSGDLHMEDYEPNVLNLGVFDGKRYALPWRAAATVFMYRKDLFKKYGVKVPDTFDEMMAAAKKLQDGIKRDGLQDLYPITLRGKRGEGLNVYIFAGSFLPAWGAKWFDKDGNPALDSKEAIAAASFYTDILKRYGPPGSPSMNWDDCWKLFQDGKAAMWIDSAVLGAFVCDPAQSKIADTVGFAVVPKGPAGTRHGALYEPSYVMAKSAQNKAAAWEFMKFATSRDQMLSDAVDGGNFEIGSRWVIENPKFAAKYPYPELIKAYLAMRKVAIEERPLIVKWPEVGDILGEVLQSSIAGEITPREGMLDANKRIVEVLK